MHPKYTEDKLTYLPYFQKLINDNADNDKCIKNIFNLCVVKLIRENNYIHQNQDQPTFAFAQIEIDLFFIKIISYIYL